MIELMKSANFPNFLIILTLDTKNINAHFKKLNCSSSKKVVANVK